MKPKKIVSMVLAVSLLCGMVGCAGKEEVPELLEPVKVNVRVEKVKKRDLHDMGYYDATVCAKPYAVESEVDGIIKEIVVGIGEQVTEGQVIAYLDVENLEEQRKGLQVDLAYENNTYDSQIRQNDLEQACENKKLEILQRKQNELTTEEPTTEEVTTEEPTTEDITTEEPTTQEATTEEPTSEGPTTEEASTEKGTVHMQSVVGQGTIDVCNANNEEMTPEELQAQIDMTQKRLRELQENRNYFSIKHSQAVEEIQSQLSKIGTIIADATMKAPTNGVVTCIANGSLGELQEGDMISKEQTLFVVTNPDELYISSENINMNVFEAAVQHYVLFGERKIPVEAYEYTDLELKRLRSSGKTPSKFIMTGDTNGIKAGMHTTLFLYKSEKKDTLSISTMALNNDGGKTYVFKNVDGKKERVDIEVGQKYGLYVEVKSGIREGEEVYVTQ